MHILTRNPECARCGGRATINNSVDVIARATDAYQGQGVSSSEFVKLSLHAIGVQIFGGTRFRCDECGELFSNPAQRCEDVSVSSRVAQKEVDLLND